MMLMRMIYKSLRQNWRSSLWMILTLSACAALVAVFAILKWDLKSQMEHTFESMGADARFYISPEAPDASKEKKKFLSLVKERGGQAVSLEVYAARIERSPVAVASGDYQGLKEMTPYWAVAGQRPQKKGECMVGRKLARRFKLQRGDLIELQWEEGQGPARLEVTGILDSGDEEEERIFVAHEISGSPVYHYGLLQMAEDLERLEKSCRKESVPVRIQALGQLRHGEEKILAKMEIMAILTLAVVLVLTALGVSSIVVARIFERKKEFALLRALGAGKKNLFRLFLWESSLLGTVSTLVGFGAGSLVAHFASRQIFHLGVFPTWEAFVITLLITLGVSLSTGFVATYRALKIQPAVALRGE